MHSNVKCGGDEVPSLVQTHLKKKKYIYLKSNTGKEKRPLLTNTVTNTVADGEGP